MNPLESRNWAKTYGPSSRITHRSAAFDNSLPCIASYRRHRHSHTELPRAYQQCLLSTNRKRRGVVRASITRLDGCIKELEGKDEKSPGDLETAQRTLKKLEELDADFKTYHFAIVDAAEEEALDDEQTILDGHDDRIAGLVARAQQLVSKLGAIEPSTTSDSNTRRVLSKRLGCVEKNLQPIREAVKVITLTDTCLLRQYESRLGDLRSELENISLEILSLEDDDDKLSDLEAKLSKDIFHTCLEIRRRLQGVPRDSPTPVEKGGLKLPKLDVPTFDGSVVNWRSFLEQFTISVHSQTKLSNTEKLAYLKHAVKEGSARYVVEGLSGSGDHYSEAVECLRKRYDRPRLIHQAHVRAILEAPALKDGNGRELQRLHDSINQHLRALSAMGQEPSGSFVTSLVELKLDGTTMFEWQKHSEGSTQVPHYTDLMDFLNMRAQASESSVPDLQRKKGLHRSFVASYQESCVLCKASKHPMYACPKFKSLPHEQMVSVLKNHNLCWNCLKPGHVVKQCPSSQRCRRCQKPHHTHLHIEVKPNDTNSSDGEPTDQSKVLSHVSNAKAKSHQVMLMTCRVLAISPYGITTQARALLDSASSTSFASERLVQRLRLPRSRQLAQIAGIGGNSMNQTVVHFAVAPVWYSHKALQVEAFVLPKVTGELPVYPVPFHQEWGHLSGIRLADPDFGCPGNVDVLLGADVFSSVILHGRRCGPPNSPTAFETCFGWALSGAVQCGQQQGLYASHHVSALSVDDTLRKFWEVEDSSVQTSRLQN